MTAEPIYNLRRSPLLDFMEEHYEILPPAPITGPFLIENSPWLAEPMHALTDPLIREVTTQFAAQGGKNLISEGFIAYTILHSPGNILFYGQTDNDAETFATDRVLKRARSIPLLQNVWPGTKAAAKINQVHLAHLTLEFLGVSKSNIEGKSAPFILCDEKHLKQWAGMSEIVKERASAYWDHKIFNLSTAGKEGSEIDLDFNRGSKEDWHLGCPACHELVRLSWSQEHQTIIWTPPEGTEKPKGILDIRKLVRFKCPHEGCNCEERDTVPLRKEMNRLGGYVCDNPSAPTDHRSFHVSQIAYPWRPWERLVEKWIYAMEKARTGDLSDLETFVIRTMGHTWERRASNNSTANITGDYNLGEIWEDEKERFATVDVQAKDGRHFWVVIRAWASGGRSRLIEATRAESWDAVELLIAEHHVKPRRVGVDSRFATDEVKEVCAKNEWHYMIADMTRDEYPWKIASGATVLRPFKKSTWHDTRVKEGVRQYARGIIFSKSWARGVLANRIGGQGTEWGLPADVKNLVFRGTLKAESSYLAQLNSWVEREVETNKTTGAKKLMWVQINTDDHIRACEEMQLVLAAISDFFPSELAAGKRSGD